AFLIFSTNLKPDNLGDEAFLRRIQYKMLLRSPDEAEFASIFQSFCKSKELPCPEGVLPRLIEQQYRKTGKIFRRCHPRDMISHAIDLIHFEKLPFVLTEDVLRRAFEGCFLQELED
ncbi:MAG: ATP-binding protein, partial [Acidobacteriota bacterium]|nr:ATP-binding protein [Acidobacteriota bacterium]